MRRSALPAAAGGVPLSIEPTVGWRAWRLVREGGELRLRSLIKRDPWPALEICRAVCREQRRPGRHPAPQHGCTCGYYAADSWSSLVGTGVLGTGVAVIGGIGMWGSVIEHAHGARSEFAYPARLRLVCGRCLERKHVRDPVTVLEVDGSLAPRCGTHAGARRGTPAADVERELLATYGVDLLPRPRISRRDRWGLAYRGEVPSTGRVVRWTVAALAMTARLAIGVLFALWILGFALAMGTGVVGGVSHLVAGTSDSAGGAAETAPDLATQCGIGHGDRVTFVRCSSPSADLVGVGVRQDPAGPIADCADPTEPYSSGAHWYVCWTPSPGARVELFPASPSPFERSVGGGAVR
jgi:hypothetical protein